VARAGHRPELLVLRGVSVLVGDEQHHGRPRGLAIHHAREYLHAVLLRPRGSQGSRRLAELKLSLYFVPVHIDPRRHTVQHAAYARSVAGAEDGEPQHGADGVHFTTSTLAPSAFMSSGNRG